MTPLRSPARLALRLLPGLALALAAMPAAGKDLTAAQAATAKRAAMARADAIAARTAATRPQPVQPSAVQQPTAVAREDDLAAAPTVRAAPDNAATIDAAAEPMTGDAQVATGIGASEPAQAADALAPATLEPSAPAAGEAPVQLAAGPANATDAGTGLVAPNASSDEAPLQLAAGPGRLDDEPIELAAGPGRLDDGPMELAAGPGSLNLADAGASDRKGRRTEDARLQWRGFLQQETAYTYASPGHMSTAVLRAQVGTQGRVHSNLKWKMSFRGEFDPVYAWSDFYPDAARRDQRLFTLIGETYIDTTVKGWDLRLGRQNIVWGEMVGLFFADVVTAKDLRHFILPSFDVIRLPQWAVRGEYFIGKDSHVELLWIPVTTFDRIGKPGAEFYPFQAPAPAGFTQNFRDDQQPARSLANSNVGARFSTLRQGWDLSAFWYRSMDSAATFYSEIIPTGPASGTIVYTPRHDRIWQTGGTVSKDVNASVMFKAEAVYTSGRSFNVTRATQPGGVVQSDTVDYALGLDFTLPDDARLNTQVFQRVYTSHDKLQPKMEAEMLWIQSLNRWENLIRPRVIWKLDTNLRLAAGVDIFNGPVTGALGRFNNRDRIYVETRYDF